jgi:hypothetical protein
VGGGDKKKTETTYTPPTWAESGARDAVSIGRRISRQQYEEYGGERVAGLSQNEQLGMKRAGYSRSLAQPYFNKAEGSLERGTQQFKDADMQDYMNPYIKGALDPAAREIREEGAREGHALDARAASMNAFGGSRAALAQSENREKTLQGVSDLYGQGYARAYESAVGIWGDERARDMQAAGRFQLMGEGQFNMAEQDISTLMTTGATDRGIQQAMKDFDYQQFTEQRDWDFRNLAGLIASLEGSKGSYSTTTTTTEGTKTDNTAEYVGAIAQVIAAIYGSDERLKDNIKFVGTYMGYKLYTWTWNAIAKSLGINSLEFGVLAQEVTHTGCVTRSPDHGFLMVNYRKLFGE